MSHAFFIIRTDAGDTTAHQTVLAGTSNVTVTPGRCIRRARADDPPGLRTVASYSAPIRGGQTFWPVARSGITGYPASVPVLGGLETAMDHATQVILTRRVLDLIVTGRKEMADTVFHNPVSSYISEQRAREEYNWLFLREPLLHALSCEMASPGAYVASELSGVPIVAVRSAQGEIRAFLNICRHRGARIAGGRGSAPRGFACPYHGWRYDLDGRLRSLQPPDAFRGERCDDHSLIPLPVVEKYGFVWVAASPGIVIDPDTLLDGLAPELASYGFEGYYPFETRTFVKQFNWKLAVDTFLESWHLTTLHRDTVAAIFHPTVNIYDEFGRNGRLTLPRRSILELRGASECTWDLLRHSAIIYRVFPNLLLAWQGDHLSVWRAFPVGNDPGACTIEATLFIPEPPTSEAAAGHWRRNLDLLMRTVDEEDFVICRGVQKGFSSGAQTHIMFGRNEPGLAHFHREVQRALDHRDSCRISAAG